MLRRGAATKHQIENSWLNVTENNFITLDFIVKYSS